jgi:hypothetical protein
MIFLPSMNQGFTIPERKVSTLEGDD